MLEGAPEITPLSLTGIAPALTRACTTPNTAPTQMAMKAVPMYASPSRSSRGYRAVTFIVPPSNSSGSAHATAWRGQTRGRGQAVNPSAIEPVRLIHGQTGVHGMVAGTAVFIAQNQVLALVVESVRGLADIARDDHQVNVGIDDLKTVY